MWCWGGGQHTFGALQWLQRREQRVNGALPRWLLEVRGDVLRAGTPMPIRRSLAGSHQFVQGESRAVPLHC